MSWILLAGHRLFIPSLAEVRAVEKQLKAQRAAAAGQPAR